MIEVEATVSLPRLGRGQTAVVDETDPTVRKWLRAGYLVKVSPPRPPPASS